MIVKNVLILQKLENTGTLKHRGAFAEWVNACRRVPHLVAWDEVSLPGFTWAGYAHSTPFSSLRHHTIATQCLTWANSTAGRQT